MLVCVSKMQMISLQTCYTEQCSITEPAVWNWRNTDPSGELDNRLEENVSAMKEKNAGADTLEGQNIHVYKSVKIKRASGNTLMGRQVYTIVRMGQNIRWKKLAIHHSYKAITKKGDAPWCSSCLLLQELQVIWRESYVSKYISHNMFRWYVDQRLQMSLQPIRAAMFHKGFCSIPPQVYRYNFSLRKVGVGIDIISLFKVWPRHNVWRTTIKSKDYYIYKFFFCILQLRISSLNELVKMCVHVLYNDAQHFFIALGRCDGLCSMWKQISKLIWEGGINRYTGILD